MLRIQALRLLVLGALALSALSAQAQSAGALHGSTEPIQVSGVLRYAGNNQPANEVIVRLESLAGGFVTEVRTDRLGKFRFTGLSPVQYHVEIRHPGYREILREVNLVMTSAEYLQLTLVPDEPARGTPAAPSPTKVLDANVPPEARKEFEKGDAALASEKKDKMAEGAQHLEKAVALYPNFLEANLRLGTAYMDLQQWDKAEQALKRALAINPKTANAYFALGELYWRQKRYADAEKMLRQGLAIEDRSWQGHFTLGRLYLAQNDLPKAGQQ